MTEEFWGQFWPQFWGGVAATVFIATLTIAFTYIARLRITLFLHGVVKNMKKRIVMEEARLKAEYESKNK
ncbi:MAG: hypothetical protein PHT88_01645 [Candidatus Moranbacteria bacterium]|nr:hypothetical protein [Candidatus Moranbacteria bacterium]